MKTGRGCALALGILLLFAFAFFQVAPLFVPKEFEQELAKVERPEWMPQKRSEPTTETPSTGRASAPNTIETAALQGDPCADFEERLCQALEAMPKLPDSEGEPFLPKVSAESFAEMEQAFSQVRGLLACPDFAGPWLMEGDCDVAPVLGLWRVCELGLSLGAYKYDQGNTGEALGFWLDSIALSRLAMGRAMDLTAFSSRAFVGRQLARLLETRLLAEEDTQRILDAMRAFSDLEVLRRALASARYEVKETSVQWRGRGLAQSVEEIGLHWGTRNWMWASSVCRPWFARDVLNVLETLDRLDEAVNMPSCSVLAEVKRLEDELRTVSMLKPVSGWYLPALVGSVGKRLEANQNFSRARVIIAIEQHKLRTGACPENPDVVAPFFGGQVPNDPVTCEPFEYLPMEGDCFLF